MKRCLIWTALCSLLLIACSLSVDSPGTSTTGPATAVPGMVKSPTPPTAQTLTSDTGPYPNRTAILDGVCFEYLASSAPFTWTWNTPDDLEAFFDDVDNSDLCPTPAARVTFDFSDSILMGAVQATRGCDAAYVVTRDEDTQSDTIMLKAQLVVQPGCAYELVEPLVIAVPRDSGDIALTLTQGSAL